MVAVEQALRRGAKNVRLDTFSFQEPGFYKRHGYHVFGELQDFPPRASKLLPCKTTLRDEWRKVKNCCKPMTGIRSE